MLTQGKWSYVANFYSLSPLKTFVIYVEGLYFVLRFSVQVKLEGNLRYIVSRMEKETKTRYKYKP
jgi:hypothetical protein